jgi:hypothetical protein
MTYTPEQRAAFAAKRAEREARETAQIAAIGAAASNLASLRRMNLKPLNQNLLWAEWDFAKALKEWDGNGNFDDMFGDACHSLGVDEDGDDLPADPDEYGDYLYEQRRDRLLDEQIDREVGK